MSNVPKAKTSPIILFGTELGYVMDQWNMRLNSEQEILVSPTEMFNALVDAAELTVETLIDDIAECENMTEVDNIVKEWIS